MRVFKNIKDALKLSKKDSKFDRVISVSAREFKDSNRWDFDVRTCSFFEEVESWEDKEKIDFIVHCIHIEHQYYRKNTNNNERAAAEAYKDKLLKKKLLIDGEDLDKILKAAFDREKNDEYALNYLPISNMLNQIKRQHKNKKPSEKMITVLERFKGGLDKVKNSYYAKTKGKVIDKINDIIYMGDEENRPIQPSLFVTDDAFAPYANPMIEALPDEQKHIWYQIISKAKTASGGKPSQKFLKNAKPIVQELGTDRFKKILNDWFIFLRKLKHTEHQNTHTYNDGSTWDYTTNTYLCGANSDTLKGLVWMCSHFHDNATINNIAALCERCFRKIPGVGPAAAALGNACIFTLYKSKGMAGIGHLSRLKLKIKQTNTKKLIDKYLNEAAEAKNVSLHQIEDMAVDDFGLEHHQKIVQFDDYQCILEITGVGKSTLKWIKPDGKSQKSVPAFVKTKYADKLKKIKARKKEMEKILTAQRDRIDRMFRANRTWNLEDFKSYYFEHGLMSYLTKKIIWNITQNETTTPVIYLNNQWVTSDNQAFEIQDDAEISLWHPATERVAAVQHWREFMLEHQIQQPLKQAYREVYLLTDAEINTKSYSNRMAAHILKQHQFNMLAKVRGWKYSLILVYDGGYNERAEVLLPEYGLRAEYWVNELYADDAWSEHSGAYTYITTDQLRFVNTENEEVLDLVDIPPVPFSEILRDVDLFVGVASVGNDPQWQDSGGLPAHRDYWHSYSFGDLSEIAKNRKEILEGLVPRLKIKDVSEIKDKFLVVKGKLRTYKIHIGSTNILMEPNDQYLCIVPDRSKKDVTQDLFIPFEGDKGLSIILSKAFLLANDDTITDSTITSQINRK